MSPVEFEQDGTISSKIVSFFPQPRALNVALPADEIFSALVNKCAATLTSSDGNNGWFASRFWIGSTNRFVLDGFFRSRFWWFR